MAGGKKRSRKPITTEADLLQEFGVSKLPEVVNNPTAEARLIQVAPDLSPELAVKGWGRIFTLEHLSPLPVSESTFSRGSGSPTQQLELFALLNLGPVQSLASGVLSAAEAVQRFYHADNCLYVRKRLRNKEANVIMSHGVQLPDLFDCLPAEEVQREFYHELETIRSLCLKLLEKVGPPRSPPSVG